MRWTLHSVCQVRNLYLVRLACQRLASLHLPDADSIALCGKRLLCCKFILVTIILGASNESMGESSINSSSSVRVILRKVRIRVMMILMLMRVLWVILLLYPCMKEQIYPFLIATFSLFSFQSVTA